MVVLGEKVLKYLCDSCLSCTMFMARQQQQQQSEEEASGAEGAALFVLSFGLLTVQDLWLEYTKKGETGGKSIREMEALGEHWTGSRSRNGPNQTAASKRRALWKCLEHLIHVHRCKAEEAVDLVESWRVRCKYTTATMIDQLGKMGRQIMMDHFDSICPSK